MPDHPDFRLTLRRGGVLVVDWHPWLTTGGPLMTMLRARGRAGCAIADVSVVRDEDEVATEAIVRFLAGSAPEAVVDWARDVGYRRVWLPGDVVDLPGPREGEAETRCSGCRVRLSDGTPEFWEHVRGLGRFPASCPLCGADLPHWRVRQTPGAGADPAPMTTSRRTPCS